MKKFLLFIYIIIQSTGLYSRLLINEIVTDTSDDWVELYYHSNEKLSLNISNLFVTMYYGTNEPLAAEPVTIYSYDRVETPYDDRFIVVHLTEENLADETDRTGDTNRNGYIDVYCNNYYASLWNSDGVVAIDNDDDPSNSGIIDFLAYSNRDGEINSTIKSYMEYAIYFNQWNSCSSENFQLCAADIGPGGLKSYMSLSRKKFTDSNGLNDFTVTNFQTPGKPNITTSITGNKKIFKCLKKKISIVPNHRILSKGAIPLFIYNNCNLKFRVFTITGLMLYESPLYRSVPPGNFTLNWNSIKRKSSTPTGLYIGRIEAISTEHETSEVKSIFIILSRYK